MLDSAVGARYVPVLVELLEAVFAIGVPAGQVQWDSPAGFVSFKADSALHSHRLKSWLNCVVLTFDLRLL